MLKKPRILVVGDLMVDEYLKGSCERISPEAPVQVVDIKTQTSVLGGAGNVVNNLRALECDVSIASVLGEDALAKDVITMLEQKSVDTSLIVGESTRVTTKKTRVLAASQQIIRFDSETKVPISSQSSTMLFENIQAQIEKIDVVLLSDYGKGVLEPQITQQIISLCKTRKIPVLVDPKGDDYTKYKGATLLTPNKKEASLATSLQINSHKSILQALKQLKNIATLEYSLITLSQDGIALFDGKDFEVFPTVTKEVFDVTGAGDTVLASLGYKLALGCDIKEAIRFANFAAGVVVAKVGSATATLAEIEELKSSLHKSSFLDKIVDIETVSNRSMLFHDLNKKVVFTNGCFDILHRGHVEYLQRARECGDILILGLNSDTSVSKLKGPKRPINTQEDRACVLAALEFVDYVVIFEEETPLELIKSIKPHVLVKGGDYRGKEVVGSDVADEVQLIDFVEGKSTTNIIRKIQQ